MAHHISFVGSRQQALAKVGVLGWGMDGPYVHDGLH